MNVKLPTILLLSVTTSFATPSFAGPYNEGGYIVSLTADDNNDCYIQLAGTPTGSPFQGGIWDCNTAYGEKMADLARSAMIVGLAVDVTFEGNGAVNKPVHAIRIRNY